MYCFFLAQAVNSLPRKMNFERNARPSKLSGAMLLKTVLERWPLRTWLSPKQRVLYQSQRLHQAAGRSDGQLAVVRKVRDMKVSDSRVLAILAVEGLSCLEEDVQTVDEFFDAGIRILYEYQSKLRLALSTGAYVEAM